MKGHRESHPNGPGMAWLLLQDLRPHGLSGGKVEKAQGTFFFFLSSGVFVVFVSSCVCVCFVVVFCCSIWFSCFFLFWFLFVQQKSFQKLEKQLENEGLRALLHYLEPQRDLADGSSQAVGRFNGWGRDDKKCQSIQTLMVQR